MNTFDTGIRRRITLPALGTVALMAGLCLGPIAAFADTSVDDMTPAAEVAEVEQSDISSLQLPTLPAADEDAEAGEPAEVAAPKPDDTPLEDDATPATSADVAGSGPNAEFSATTGLISGTVTDKDGNPLAGAYVYLFVGDDISWTSYEYTDADGHSGRASSCPAPTPSASPSPGSPSSTTATRAGATSRRT